MLDWILTGLAFSGCVGLAVFANWKASQPWDDLKPRVLPWRLIMIAAGFCAILALVHAVNILGFETGPEHAVFGRGF
ncbi:MAG: hypothetical protein AAFO51_08460 [Pseudomonadota bacterium]